MALSHKRYWWFLIQLCAERGFLTEPCFGSAAIQASNTACGHGEGDEMNSHNGLLLFRNPKPSKTPQCRCAWGADWRCCEQPQRTALLPRSCYILTTRLCFPTTPAVLSQGLFQHAPALPNQHDLPAVSSQHIHLRGRGAQKHAASRATI